jgi:hypothetical protein
VELSYGAIIRQGTIQDFQDLGQLTALVEAANEVPEDPPLVEGPENEADVVKDDQQPLDDNRGTKGRLIEVEARAEGRVLWRTYMTYIRAAGIVSWVLTILLMLLIRAINIGNQVNLYNDLSISSECLHLDY